MHESHKLLLKKRSICNPYLSVHDNDLARALRKKVEEGDNWQYVAGIRYGYIYSWEKERANISVADFLVKYDPDKRYNDDLLSTYRGCISIDVIRDGTGETDIEFVKITVWEGDLVDGGRTDKRCTLYLSGPWWTIKGFADKVERSWFNYTQKLVDAEEALRIETRRLAVADEVLAGTYVFLKDEEDE